VKLLLAHGVHVNTRDRGGQTVLFRAVQVGSPTVVKGLLRYGAHVLLDKGAMVNARDNEGTTPLMWAATYAGPKAIQLLLDKGADIHMKDNKGNTALKMTDDRRKLKLLQKAANGKQAGRNYRVYFPLYTPLDEPRSWLDTYDGQHLVRHTAIGYLPRQILYVAQTDHLYLMYTRQLKTLSGSIISLPGSDSSGDQTIENPTQPVTMLDTDASGKIAYYVDGAHKSSMVH
jgi:hypothetical protein